MNVSHGESRCRLCKIQDGSLWSCRSEPPLGDRKRLPAILWVDSDAIKGVISLGKSRQSWEQKG